MTQTLDPITYKRRQARLRDGQPRDWAHRREVLMAVLKGAVAGPQAFAMAIVRTMVKAARKDLAKKEDEQ